MNIKCTILKLITCLFLSPIIIYGILIVARLFGAYYEMSHGETFIIWILMAILIANSWIWKKKD